MAISAAGLRPGAGIAGRWCGAFSGGQVGCGDRATLLGRSPRYHVIWLVCGQCGTEMALLFYDQGDLPMCAKLPGRSDGAPAVKLDAVTRQPADAGFGGRFYLVGYLPTYAAAVFLLVLVWAGAPGWAGTPGHRIRFTAAWATASHLSLGEVVLVALAVALLAVLLQPLQLAMMRMAQGSWQPWPGTRWALQWQEHRRNRLAEAARLPQGSELADAAIQRAGAAGHELRRRFPRPGHLLQPTALGNVLAAMHDSAGRAYGLDAVTAWPRLYPVLGEQARALADDRRDTLDGAVRMTVTMAVTAVASVLLLTCSSWWVLLALVPAGIAVLAYNAAVQAALAYAETVHVAFDLHRADLLTALRMEPPARPDAERDLNEHWCDLWRQGIPLPATLQYTTSSDKPAGQD